MSDLRWCLRIEEFCRSHGLPFETTFNSIRGKDWYKFAYSQFVAGASAEHVESYLRAAVRDAGLID